MKNEQAPGPKGIPIQLLTYGSSSLFQLLTLIFNCCLKGSQLLSEWKTECMKLAQVIDWQTPSEDYLKKLLKHECKTKFIT